MTARIIIFGISCFLLIFNCGFLLSSSRAQTAHPFKLDANDIRWKHLSYKAKNFLGTVTTDVHLKNIPTKQAGEFLITAPQGVTLKAADTKTFIITVHSVFDLLIGSNHTFQTKAWYNPKKATVLQRVRFRQGNEQWKKTYRFTRKGVFRFRKRPNSSDEAKLPQEHWTNIEESFFPYDLSKAGCCSILEPSGLLYLVSAIDFTLENKPLSLCVFNKKQLHQVQIRSEGLKRLKVNYMEKSKDNETSRKGKIDSVKISFDSRSLVEPNQEAEMFSFLGLKGNFDIFINKETRIPIQINGKIPKIGDVKIQLLEVQLNSKIVP